MRSAVGTIVLIAILLAGACTSGTTHRASRSTSAASSAVHTTPRNVSTSAAPLSAPARPKRARPVELPRRTAMPVPGATISAAARAAGLRDIYTVVPDAVVDLAYATTDNFTHVRLYPRNARCLVHESMLAGLRTAAAELRRQGYVIVFWDCYRPHAAQQRMWTVVPDPNWVARPGPYATSHEAGRSVDVTLARAGCGVRCLLDMGTGFDDFTARAHAFATDGVSATAQANRALLRRAMAAGGITVYSGEWWHFDGPGSGTPRPHLDAPVY